MATNEKKKTKMVFDCNIGVGRQFLFIRGNCKPKFKEYDLPAKSIKSDLPCMDVVQPADREKLKGHE